MALDMPETFVKDVEIPVYHPFKSESTCDNQLLVDLGSRPGDDKSEDQKSLLFGLFSPLFLGRCEDRVPDE